MAKLPLEVRFWSKVIRRGEDECWEFTYKLSIDGYGQFGYERKAVKAHRMAYKLSIGELLKGHVIMHTCDNPKCCNPKHLVQGLQRDNVLDMVRKKRNVPCRGDMSGTRKLNSQQVQDIRSKYTGKYGEKSKLAREYGVVVTTIINILWRRNWK